MAGGGGVGFERRWRGEGDLKGTNLALSRREGVGMLWPHALGALIPSDCVCGLIMELFFNINTGMRRSLSTPQMYFRYCMVFPPRRPLLYLSTQN